MAGLDSEVMVVTDGEQVLDYLLKKGIYSESKIPELIILDINIPKIDGREILKYIKANTAYKKIPVIMYTSSELPVDKEFCIKNEAEYYLVKANSTEDFENNTKLFASIMSNLTNKNNMA